MKEGAGYDELTLIELGARVRLAFRASTTKSIPVGNGIYAVG